MTLAADILCAGIILLLIICLPLPKWNKEARSRWTP